MILTNDLGLPEPFVDAARSNHSYKPGRYSVTELLKGTRETILTRRHDGEIISDVSDMVWLIFGTAVHSILEGSSETDTQLKENKLVIPIMDGYELSGIFDLYDDAAGMVTDYKTGTVWKVIKNEWDDYRTQVLAYAWMLRQIGFDVHRGQIVMLLKDHSLTKAQVDKSYPQHPVVTVEWVFTSMEFAEFGRWVKARFEEIKTAEQLADDELPLCPPEKRWYEPDKWAVKLKNAKRARRVLEDEADAIVLAQDLTDREGKPYIVEYRPGSDKKCLHYCKATHWCTYYQQKYGDAPCGV